MDICQKVSNLWILFIITFIVIIFTDGTNINLNYVQYILFNLYLVIFICEEIINITYNIIYINYISLIFDYK